MQTTPQQADFWYRERFGEARVWAVAPGPGARFWGEFQNKGIIAIGWDELGDLQEFDTRSDIHERLREVLDRPNPSNDSLACYQFAHEMQPGDHVLIKQGRTLLLGHGVIESDYEFDESRPEFRSTRRVRWEKIGHWQFPKERAITVKTLTDFSRYRQWVMFAFQLMEGKPPVEDAAFSQRAFELLRAIHEEPTRAFYEEHAQDFKSHVEQPVKNLLNAVAAELDTAVKEVLETEKRLFSQFRKNDYGQGGAWDYYWGAFYPRGGKRTSSPQLFVWVNRHQLEYGFAIGQLGSEHRTKFVNNVHKYRLAFEAAMERHTKPEQFVFGTTTDSGDSSDSTKTQPNLQSWLKDIDNHEVSVRVVVPREELFSEPVADLRQRIIRAFHQLFPFVLLATSDDPLTSVSEYWGEDGDDREIQEKYPLEQCAEETGFDAATLAQWADAVNRKGQAVFYGPPGTGKTYMAKRIARHLVGGGDGFVEIVQFHPAYAYEDFIQGIRPRTRGDGKLEYQMVPGRFLEFCREARKRSGQCVLIVDEFNRANLSRVFGELMYLLEYRDAEIPLSGGGSFSIPENVRIIGTMNTADRSIALVDHALRRRFAFLALHPDFEILRFYHSKTDKPVAALVESLIDKLKEVNQRIGDPNYHLGITFFLNWDLEAHLEAIWRMEIEPYLEEYFFDDLSTVRNFRWETISEELGR